MWPAARGLAIAAACGVAAGGPVPVRADGLPVAAVVVAPGAHPLERLAGAELARYVGRVYRAHAVAASRAPRGSGPVLFVGAGAVRASGAWSAIPRLSEQGIALESARWRGRDAVCVIGGSPRATLWAAYRLAERWGVRYLLHGDVMPARRDLRLPAFREVSEPRLRVRQWRLINDFAIGPESWGARDYRPVIDQLARLRFNRILLSVYPWQPFIDLRYAGVSRSSAWLWYGYRYPITPDMPGRALFPAAMREFWNPDLPRGAPYPVFAAAGRRYVRGLIAYARSRGMECGMTAWLTEFPPEFARVLTRSQKVHQLGELDVVPTADTDIDDPRLAGLAAAALRTVVDTYPDLDFVAISAPEFRSWTGQYERAWKRMAARHGFERDLSLDAVLRAAAARKDYPGGPERAIDEVKADIVALDFTDRLITERRALAGSRRPGIRLAYSTAEELFPVLARVAPPGSETMNILDYTPSRAVKRRAALADIPAGRMPSVLITTLHDDNVGVIPQLMTTPIHELITDIRRLGWAGFSTRYWLIGDHDPCVAYLARAAWDADATPETVARDQVAAVCGPAAVAPMLRAFAELERTTVSLEWNALGLTFPVPGMIMGQWNAGAPAPVVAEARRGYARALAAVQDARRVTLPRGAAYTAYWQGRLAFGVVYMDLVAAVHAAAANEKAGDRAMALRRARGCVALARTAIELMASAARDQSDRATVAVLGEYVYRPLKAKAAQLERN